MDNLGDLSDAIDKLRISVLLGDEQDLTAGLGPEATQYALLALNALETA